MGDLADLACAAEAAGPQPNGAGRRDRLAALLELAAADDAAGFREALDGAGKEAELADGVGLWYGRSKAYEPRTPLMVAATYGSATVVSLLLGLSCVDVNRRPGVDGATALHCAASSGSRNSVAVVKLLLAAGADPATPDSAGRFPADVILAPPGAPDALGDLEMLLGRRRGLAVTTLVPSRYSSPPPSSSPDDDNRSPSSWSLSPIVVDRGRKEYPVDPTLPDIKSSMYASDEFRMYMFKVRPCSRAYSHDWTECPFVHPGENARRRDPRNHLYTAVPCPNFRRPGGCPSGDSCVFAHGVFESWLHPSQYRTRLCKEGAACGRRICFFAHDEDELRHVPHNNGAGLLSPRATSSIDMTAAAALGLLPGSPTRHCVPPLGSPSSVNNGVGAATHWLQGSRLRSSFNSRDAQLDDLGTLLEWESQYLGALSLPQSSRSQHRLSAGLSIRPTGITPSSLEEMYASDMAMSPRFTNDQGHSVYSPAHKSAILNKIHQQKGLLSSVNTNRMYSPRSLDPSALMHSPFGGMSPRSPRTMEPTSSPLSARVGSTVTQCEVFDQFSSLKKHQVPRVGSPQNSNASWGNIGTSKSKVDWGVDDEELVRLRRSMQTGVAEEEPDVSWVQSLVNHAEMNGKKG
jgi:hypothetical protein